MYVFGHTNGCHLLLLDHSQPPSSTLTKLFHCHKGESLGMRLMLLLSYGNIFESMTIQMSYDHVTILRLYVCVHLCYVVMF